jgi:hypothetical protein
MDRLKQLELLKLSLVIVFLSFRREAEVPFVSFFDKNLITIITIINHILNHINSVAESVGFRARF